MTAIREIELSTPLQSISGLPSRCMLVLRWRGRIVGRLFTDVQDGTIAVERLQALITTALGPEAVRYWLDEHLGFSECVRVDPLPLTATAAICTHERPEQLRLALAAIESLRPGPLETLVIDNAPSSTATRSVVNEFPRVRYVLEPTRGLNVARNRALLEARGEIVAFTDDDAVPEPEWLAALLRNFQTARTACVTGLTLPAVLDTPAQELFEEHCTFARGFKRRLFDGEVDNPLAAGPVGAGANMAVHRDTVLQLGGFDERLDGGQPTKSGGDHEMFTRIMRAGLRIVYEPAAVSWHSHRQTLEEVRQTVYGYGVGVYAMWTGLLIEGRELGVLKLAWSWVRHSQFRALLPIKGMSPDARTLVRDEIRGCLHGPAAWFAARRRLRERSHG